MSAVTSARDRLRRRPMRRQGFMAAWLVLVWVGLWGDASPGTVLAGVVVAVVVLTVLPLPDLPRTGGIHPLPLLRLAGAMAVDLLRSSVEVGWLAVRPGPPPGVAVVGVRLRTDSDAVQALVAELVSLVPGTVVLDVDDEARTIHVHVIGVHDEAGLQTARDRVLRLEDRVLAVVGTQAVPRELPAGRSRPTNRPGGAA